MIFTIPTLTFTVILHSNTIGNNVCVCVCACERWGGGTVHTGETALLITAHSIGSRMVKKKPETRIQLADRREAVLERTQKRSEPCKNTSPWHHHISIHAGRAKMEDDTLNDIIIKRNTPGMILY